MSRMLVSHDGVLKWARVTPTGIEFDPVTDADRATEPNTEYILVRGDTVVARASALGWPDAWRLFDKSNPGWRDTGVSAFVAVG